MKVTDMDFENPWRPNYELKAFLGWMLTPVAAYVWWCFNTALPIAPLYLVVSIAVFMAAWRVPGALRLWRLQRHLAGRPLEFVSLDQLKKKAAGKSKNGDQVWLGQGFVWEQKHTQRVHEITKRSISATMKNTPTKLQDPDDIGQRWIHGVEPMETDLYQAVSHANGMTLIVGTTGAGKTRLYDILISHAILRGEPVIIIDPKGDHELRENARRCCESIGQGYRFKQFMPSHPEMSVRINPLKHYNRVTELASRIAALIQSEAATDPFKAFGWQAVNNICQALVTINEEPNLVLIKRYVEGGVGRLLWRALEAHFSRVLTLEDARAIPLYDPTATGDTPGQQLVNTIFSRTKSNDDAKARALGDAYQTWLPDKHRKPELDALVSMSEHDRTHFSKMITNLIPTLGMLTSGPLAELLSPTLVDAQRDADILDPRSAIENGVVLYVSLDSLSDNIVGTAIGSMMLANFVAIAGARYNYGGADNHVNMFIDEAAEVVGPPTVQMLNKGRGAKFRLYVATQTIPDFEVRLGGEAQALQLLGNMNNLISLRVIDQKTQEYVVSNLPKTRIQTLMRQQSVSSASDSPFMFSASTGERLSEEEADLFPAPLLGMLPNLEYIAKISGGTIVKGRLPILQGQDRA